MAVAVTMVMTVAMTMVMVVAWLRPSQTSVCLELFYTPCVQDTRVGACRLQASMRKSLDYRFQIFLGSFRGAWQCDDYGLIPDSGDRSGHHSD
jgi:hypothetical protein